jgi:hypothetical protein
MNKRHSLCKTDIAAELAVQEELVSVRGALQIALGMRATQNGASPIDAFWSTAFNLGVREFPTKAEIHVSFNPLKHEDMKGGLLRGDKSKILQVGWTFGKLVLLRAQVEPVCEKDDWPWNDGFQKD